MCDDPIYKVIFQNQGKIVEIYARQVSQGALFGFIEIEELVFGARSSLVVDPTEESLKTEFEGVRRVYLPMHAVIRIDEVDKEGVASVRDAADPEEGDLRPFPVPVYAPGNEPGSD